MKEDLYQIYKAAKDIVCAEDTLEEMGASEQLLAIGLSTACISFDLADPQYLERYENENKSTKA